MTYEETRLRDQRQAMRHANAARLSGGRSLMDRIEENARRQGPTPADQIEERDAALRQIIQSPATRRAMAGTLPPKEYAR